MKMHNKKRGFTIVELVIVIAVIAILSAVLIPTFAGVVKKSRQSADETAVRNMNTILAADGAVEPTNVFELWDVLAENGVDNDSYKPMQNDTFFFWDSSINTVVYADENYNVTYPADQVENTNKAAWVSLSGEIKEAKLSDVVISEEGVATVESAEEYIALVEAINDGKSKVKNVTTIKLPAEMYFMGASASIELVKGESTAKPATLTIQPEQSGGETKMYGVVNMGAIREGGENSAGVGRNYCNGLIGTVQYANVTFRGLVLENCAFGDATTQLVGALVGTVEDATVDVKNVDLKNVTVSGLMKVGAYVGQVNQRTATTKLTISSDSNAEDVTVQVTVGFAGRLVGIAYGATTAATVTVIDAISRFDDGITVQLVKDSRVEYITIDGVEYGTDMDADKKGNLTIVNPKEYCATVANYGWTAISGDQPGMYNGGAITFKYNVQGQIK